MLLHQTSLDWPDVKLLFYPKKKLDILICDHFRKLLSILVCKQDTYVHNAQELSSLSWSSRLATEHITFNGCGLTGHKTAHKATDEVRYSECDMSYVYQTVIRY